MYGLTDIAYHHLAIAYFFQIQDYMYRTNWSVGHDIKNTSEAHTGPFTGQDRRGLYLFLT